MTDRAGHLLALFRSDDGGAHLVDSARRKAYTTANMNAHPSPAGEGARTTPGSDSSGSRA
ncbi:heme-binding protein [Pseudolabrys sp. Root1462]|uniref:heme-binding protein n=1 Tax=Pseudolabrys sp. Root1462 TaxID=1736466 RepID=UPI0009E6C436|nr:heme-binding protein [Pseudolabrys sp. Root1462]